MARQPLPIGAHGEIYTMQLPTGRWMARAQFRGADGRTRPVKRHRATEAKAKNALRQALAEQAGDALSGEISRMTRLAAVAELWLAEQDRLAAQGSKERTTVQKYREQYERHIKPAMGELRVHECTVGACHRFLAAKAATSTSTARMLKAILSGILGLAVIHGALDANPVRDVGAIESATKVVEALTPEQILDWLARLENSRVARRWDLADLSRWLCATGVRLGEALACGWEQVDLGERTVDVSHKLVVLKPEGLTRLPRAKTAAGDRLLPLPEWSITMLKRRKLATGGAGPIFPTIDGGWRHPQTTQDAIRRVREAAGYPTLTSHLFRRSVATVLDRGGAPARAVADQLGHSSIRTTQQYYVARGVVDRTNAEIIEQAYEL